MEKHVKNLVCSFSALPKGSKSIVFSWFYEAKDLQKAVVLNVFVGFSNEDLTSNHLSMHVSQGFVSCFCFTNVDMFYAWVAGGPENGPSKLGRIAGSKNVECG